MRCNIEHLQKTPKTDGSNLSGNIDFFAASRTSDIPNPKS